MAQPDEGDPLHLQSEAYKPDELMQIAGTRGFEHDDRTDIHNRIHRQQAVRMHRRRARRQIVSASFVMLAASLAPIYWSMNSNGMIDLRQVGEVLHQLAQKMPAVNALVVPGIAALLTILGAAWLRLWYRRERDRDWWENAAKANAAEPQQSAQGYMELFRLYARTKRRATFVMLYGVLSTYWAVLGIAASIDLGNGIAVLCATGFHLVASLIVIYLGFDIGRRYLPGNVLVTKTLILGFRAATSETQYQDAVNEAGKAEVDIIDRKPWWFYAYKVPRPSRT